VTDSAEAVLTNLQGRQVEAFYVLLVASGKYTFLPEIYDIFGRDGTVRFLEIFAGCRIKVPKLERLEKLAQHAAIYIRLEKARKNQKASVVHALALEYDLTESQIRKIHATTKKTLEVELGFKVTTR